MNPRVGVKIGLTLKILEGGKDTYQFIRPEIEISDIESGDPNIVATQLELAKKTVDATWNVVSDLLEEEIRKELNFSKGEMIRES